MATVQRKFSLIGLIVLACGQPTFGGTFSDPSGFTLTYPEGWVALNGSILTTATQNISNELQQWAANSKLDFNKVSMVLVRDGRDEFLENVNVVIVKEEIPISDRTVHELTLTLPQHYAAIGMKVSNIQGRVQKLGSNDAVVVEFQSQIPGVSSTIRQRQVMIAGGGKTYIVTCSGKAETIEEYKPVFDQVLESFQVPARVKTGFSWAQLLQKTVIGGVAGGLIGGIAWVAKKLSPKRDAKSSE